MKKQLLATSILIPTTAAVACGLSVSFKSNVHQHLNINRDKLNNDKSCLPNSIASDVVFKDTEDDDYTFEYDDEQLTAKITEYKGSDTSINIPSSVENEGKTYTVNEIGNRVFAHGVGTDFISINIPNTIIKIGYDAFSNQQNLKSIVIPNSVTSIGNNCFEFCTSLESVTLSNSISSIPFNCFWRCTSLTAITIPNSITLIGTGAFKECTSLTDTSGPDGTPGFSFDGKIDQWRTVDRSDEWYAGTSATKIQCSNGQCGVDDGMDWCFWYDYDETEHTAVVKRFRGSDKNISIPETVDFEDETYDVVGINNLVFSEKDFDSITLPNSITWIGNSAFKYCGLKTISLSNKLTSIGDGAFYGCSSLTTITIPNSITSIGKEAFKGCTSLTTLTIPNSITSIAENTFNGCSSLTSVTIPNSVTSIDVGAFNDCTSLTDTSGPSGSPGFVFSGEKNEWKLVEREVHTWHTNSPATQIKCSDGNINIDVKETLFNFEFDDETHTATVSGLNGYPGINVVIPKTVEHDGQSYTVTALDNYIFSGCSNIESIDIPESVTSIGAGVFTACTSLTSVIIPQGVTQINTGCFDSCVSLKTVTIPSTITTEDPLITENLGFWMGCFNNCQSLTDTSGPGGSCGFNFTGTKEQWKSIHKHYYWRGQDVGSATLVQCSDGKIGIEDRNVIYDFDDSNQTAKAVNFVQGPPISIEIPATIRHNGKNYTVTEIGDDAFSHFSHAQRYLTSIKIPNTVKIIGNYAFELNDTLAIVDLGGGVETLSKGCFRHCDGLHSISIPTSVKTIDDWCFVNCDNLTDTSGPNNTPGLIYQGTASEWMMSMERGQEWHNDSPITKVHCIDYDINLDAAPTESLTYTPNSDHTATVTGGGGTNTGIYIPKQVSINNETYTVTAIADDAFKNCTSVEDVFIPETVKSIGNNAFKRCTSLTSINIPNSVVSIGSHAFDQCESLEAITIPQSVTSIGDYAFTWCKSLTTVNMNAKITKIANGTFAGCEKLISVAIPNTTTAIEDRAFFDCESLMTITIPTSVKSIGSDAFRHCDSLTDTSGAGGDKPGFVFAGTIAQWKKMGRTEGWHSGVTPATLIQCSDGPCRLDDR